MNQSTVPTITLNNGVPIPQVGLGVWQAAEGTEVETAVRAALDAGYRLIDTAAIYGNEVGVGKAIKASGLPREEIFITTKLWNANHAGEDALRAFDESLQKLDCGYIDLYLIHWPLPMEGPLRRGRGKHLEKLLQRQASTRLLAFPISSRVPPGRAIEDRLSCPLLTRSSCIPMLQQKETRGLLRRTVNSRRIALLARSCAAVKCWSIQTSSNMICNKHGKTPAPKSSYALACETA
jgi:aryl-alcohol dehydrogenase-like predicted oxidoreductase